MRRTRWSRATTFVVALSLGCGVEQMDSAAAVVPARRSEGEVPTDIVRSDILRVTPPVPRAPLYTRCGTLAGESTWQPSLSDDHALLAVRTNTGTVRLIGTESLREVGELASTIGAIDGVRFSPDGRLLATESREAGQLAVWRTSDASLVHWVRTPAFLLTEHFPTDLAFSSDGRRVASGQGRIIDLETGAVAEWPADYTVEELRFVSGDRYLLSTGNLQAGSSIRSLVALYDLEQKRMLWRRDVYPSNFVFSHDGSAFAHGELDAVVYDLRQSPPIAEPIAEAGRVVGLSPDGSLVYLRREAELLSYARATQSMRARVPLPASARVLGVSPTNRLVVSVDEQTRWIDPSTGAVVRSLPEVLEALQWSKDGEVGVATSPSTLLRMFREADGASLVRLPTRPAFLPPLRGRSSLHERVRELTLLMEIAPVASAADESVTVYWEPEVRNSGSLVAYDREHKPLREFTLNYAYLRYPGMQSLAEVSAEGAVILTAEASGVNQTAPYIAAWCRSPRPSGATSLPEASAAPGAKIGEISLEHVGAAHGQPYSTLYGAVYASPMPDPVHAIVRDQEDDCTLQTRRSCSPACGPTEVCAEDGVCRPRPAGLDLGPLSVEGLRDVAGGASFVLRPVAQTYLQPGDRTLAHPAFRDGDRITLISTGSLALAPFQLSGVGISPIALSGGTLTVQRGRPFVVRWSAPEAPSQARVRIEIDLSPWHGTPEVIACEGEDTGELTVPATLLEKLVELGLSGFPTMKVSRTRITSTHTERGRVDLRISATNEVNIALEGLRSCVNNPGLCFDIPTFGTCRPDLLCGYRSAEPTPAHPKVPTSFRDYASPDGGGAR